MNIRRNSKWIWPAPLNTVRRRRLWGAGLLVVLVAVGAFVLWPSPDPPPRARQYRDFTACLLTDEQGINGEQAAPVWAGMQDASLATRARVQYLAVVGTQSVENAATFVATLAQTRCDVVFAAGKVQVSAVVAGADRFATVRFVVVGVPDGISGGLPGNVSVVESVSISDVQRDVAGMIVAAVGEKFGH